MCGIAGTYANILDAEHREIVSDILEDQHARGPDAKEITICQGRDSKAILGHNRLSIIDLSVHANQPMWDATGRYCITFNGEIYNYLELRETLKKQGFIFQTNSDTEVILNAFAFFGIDALSHFHGPFAYALFDKMTDQLWLCRDRFGVRPLYYVIDRQVLYFASSTRVLAKTLSLKPNLDYVSRGLKHLIYEDESSISPYVNMLSLRAGSYLHASINRHSPFAISEHQYYDFNYQVEQRAQTLPIEKTDDLLQLIQHTLEKAVNLRLRSDVPVGVTLSSGLDSSSIASLVSRQNKNVHGFSYSHPNNKKSEGPLVEKCANYLGIKINYISPTANEMIEGLFKTIEIQDAPFSSLSMVAQYVLYKYIRDRGFKVILGGQGGDESFMGYRKFMLFWLQDQIKQKNYMASAKYFLQMIPMLLTELSLLKTYWQHRHRYFSQSGLTNTLKLPSSTLHSIQHSSLRTRQMQDITHFSLPTLLRYEDRNAMGNSVETRLPFLDHELVELGCALPEALKLRGGYGKWPIRQIMQHKIPNQIRLAFYKRGFDIPLAPLLNQGLGKKLRDALQNQSALIKEFLHPSHTIQTAFSDQQLLQRRSAIAEAVTLLWLGKH